MMFWERILAAAVITMLTPVVLLGMLVVCTMIAVKTIINPEKPSDTEHWE